MNARLLSTTIGLGLAGAAVLGGVQQSWATQAPLVGKHQHFIVTPDGTLVPFGPYVCDAATGSGEHLAFSQFHANVHRGQANDAFDHTHNPVDVVPARCP